MCASRSLWACLGVSPGGQGRSVAPDRQQARCGSRHRFSCPWVHVRPWTVVVSIWIFTVLQALTLSSSAGGYEKTASCFFVHIATVIRLSILACFACMGASC